MLSLPNIITIGRIFMVPMIVWAITSGEALLAFWLFLAAGVSDAVDGVLAKRFGMQSELGAYLDPLADKALLMSIYITLAISGAVPAWVAIAVVSRDIMIVSAVMLAWVLDKPMTIRPLVISKLNTTAQIAVAALVLAVLGFGLEADMLMRLGLVAVGALTLASAAAYLAEWMRHMAS